MTILFLIISFLLTFAGYLIGGFYWPGTVSFFFGCANFLSWAATYILVAIYVVVYTIGVISTVQNSWKYQTNMWKELADILSTPPAFFGNDLEDRLISMGYSRIMAKVMCLIFTYFPLYRLGISILITQIVFSFDWFGNLEDPIRLTGSLVGLLLMIVVSGGAA